MLNTTIVGGSNPSSGTKYNASTKWQVHMRALGLGGISAENLSNWDLWTIGSIPIGVPIIQFESLFRRNRAWCKVLTVNQCLGRFDPYVRSQTIWDDAREAQ